MYYLKLGVPCTKNGLPLCCLDDEICQVKLCRYFLAGLKKLGNCVLRVDKTDIFTLDDIGKVMKISRERVRQIEERVLIRISRFHAKELEGYLEGYSKSPPDDYPYPIHNHKVLGMLKVGRVRG